jgi:hypothetical protein
MNFFWLLNILLKISSVSQMKYTNRSPAFLCRKKSAADCWQCDTILLLNAGYVMPLC